MNVLILGCGTIGVLAGGILTAAGHNVLGVRRHPSGLEAGFRIVPGDLADAAFWDELVQLVAGSAEDHIGSGVPSGPAFDAVLLCANPGLRRGRDNGLESGVRLLTQRLPMARLVYTGTTAVYADARGEAVDEQGAVDRADPAVAGLLAIEDAVLGHAGALVLRAPALVGPTRTHALERMRAGATSVRGDPARPFSFLHELDCAELCAEAVAGAFGSGLLNAASPQRITARDYHAALARAAGVATPAFDGTAAPSRWIDAGRLWEMCPGRRWRGHEPGGAHPGRA